ncbi:hypothetical protein KQX54_021104 [Cotesia glomerata]|uniref:Uncharacterized protein n=1 Tax=Cotesia glomerata TaxID=32391 RepID=A0AAV7JAD3_COTGL|nr:hypothetical protein KQX54_021104 [Cotesia glomerata]
MTTTTKRMLRYQEWHCEEMSRVQLAMLWIKDRMEGVSQLDCTPISHIGREKPSCNRIAAVLATTLVGSLLG